MNKTTKNNRLLTNPPKLASLIGFVALSTMVLILLSGVSVKAWQRNHLIAFLFSLLVGVGAVISVFNEGESLINKNIKSEPFLKKASEFFAVVIAGLLTFYLSNEIDLGVVVASGLVGVIAATLLPKYKYAAYCGAAYCGSFVGMSSKALLINYNEFILASLIAGLIFLIARNVFSGLGGKLGTIAFTSTTITGLLHNRQFSSSPIITDWKINFWVILMALIAALLSFYINNFLNHGPVMASGIVGLIGGLLLPILFPEYGDLLALVVICASFAGMSTIAHFPNAIYIAITGLLIGILYVFSLPVYGGAGGKLGTIAFTSDLTTYGFKTFLMKFKNQTGK